MFLNHIFFLDRLDLFKMNDLKAKIYFFIFFIFLMPPFFLTNLKSEEKFVKKELYQFDEILDNASYTINLGNLNADIFLTGHIGSGVEINIVSDLVIKNQKHNTNNQIIVLNNQKEQTLDLQKDTKIRSLNNNSRIELSIPRNININIHACIGKIVINNITGKVGLTSNTGEVIAKSLNGDITIESSGGNLIIQDSKVILSAHINSGDITLSNIHGESKLSTSGGNINIENFTGGIIAHAYSGSIHLKDILGESINGKTSSGSISGNRINGKSTFETQTGNIQLKDASGQIKLSSTDGDMNIENCKNELICKTLNGDITIDKMIGSIDAESFLGNINLDLAYSSSLKNYYYNISTIEGDVTINIPKNLSASLKSSIHGERSSQDITSDIPLSFKSQNNQIIGEALINGGLIPININSKNGYISIKDN